jgi:hypothetical protein
LCARGATSAVNSTASLHLKHSSELTADEKTMESGNLSVGRNFGEAHHGDWV